MQQTFANLPFNIEKAISDLLTQQESNEWLTKAETLHKRYIEREKSNQNKYVNDYSEVLAYLGLRTPATYAQIFGAFSQIQEMVPSWKPTSILDIGSGPGTGVWAAKTIWPSLQTAIRSDQEKYFLTIGQEITKKAAFQMNIIWRLENFTQIDPSKKMYDLVLIANVLNELTFSEQKDLIEELYRHCNGIMVILEPGTPNGIDIIQRTAKHLSNKGAILAPYINNSFVADNTHWTHFPQRFIRPEFLRRIRQQMRENKLMASDWEETKYAYVAFGKVPAEKKVWGRVIGPIKKQKGFVTIPVLTQEGINQIQVLKRNKQTYSFAANLSWGEVISSKEEIVS